MATLIPTLGSARFDSRGELRLAERLKDFLEENAFVWHNLPMGPYGRHPDFVIIHPSHGLLVLEVKDWRLDAILTADKAEVELLTESGPVRKPSPFEQARRYMFDVVSVLQQDAQLVFPGDHPLKGRPIVPFGFGVVFTNITRRQFAQTDLPQVFPEDRCIFKDEMAENSDPEDFRTRLWQMAVLYPEHAIGESFARILSKHGVPIDVAKDNRNRVSTKRAAVRLLSMHTAKGLEFPCVAVGGLGAVGRHGEPIEDGVRLTYVAITRATHEAFLTYSRVSPLIERLTA
jgi:hypothetical protein